jgi:hypothetical protein
VIVNPLTAGGVHVVSAAAAWAAGAPIAAPIAPATIPVQTTALNRFNCFPLPQ